MGRLQGLTASTPVSLPRAFGEWCEAFPFIKGKCSKEVYPVDYGQKSEKVASLQQRSCRSLPLRKPASPQAVSFAFCVPLQGKACGFESQPPAPFRGELHASSGLPSRQSPLWASPITPVTGKSPLLRRSGFLVTPYRSVVFTSGACRLSARQLIPQLGDSAALHF